MSWLETVHDNTCILWLVETVGDKLGKYLRYLDYSVISSGFDLLSLFGLHFVYTREFSCFEIPRLCLSICHPPSLFTETTIRFKSRVVL